jgi:hypothetical protein
MTDPDYLTEAQAAEAHHRGVFIHGLKTHPEAFAAVWRGEKNFEVRRDDRAPGFEVHDTLHLREYDPDSGRYSGRWIAAEVAYILRAPGFGGIAEGFVVMSLSKLTRHHE